MEGLVKNKLREHVDQILDKTLRKNISLSFSKKKEKRGVFLQGCTELIEFYFFFYLVFVLKIFFKNIIFLICF